MQEIELDNSIMDHITKKSIIAISNLHALGNSLSNSLHMNIHNHHHTIDQHRHNPALTSNHLQNTHNLFSHIHHSTTSKSATLDTTRNRRVKTRVSFPHPKIDFFILTLFSRFITKSFHIPHSFHRESERVGIGSELGWRNGEWY